MSRKVESVGRFFLMVARNESSIAVVLIPCDIFEIVLHFGKFLMWFITGSGAHDNGSVLECTRPARCFIDMFSLYGCSSMDH